MYPGLGQAQSEQQSALAASGLIHLGVARMTERHYPRESRVEQNNNTLLASRPFADVPALPQQAVHAKYTALVTWPRQGSPSQTPNSFLSANG